MAEWNRDSIIKQKKDSLINSFLGNMERSYNNLQDIKEDIKSIPGVDKFVGDDVFKEEVFKSMIYPLSRNEDLKEKYCMVAIMKCLLEADKDGKLTRYGFIPGDRGKITLCAPFAGHIEESGFKKYLYKTKRGKTFVDIINEEGIEPGAIVILTNMKKDTTEKNGPQEDVPEATLDGRNHAMVFSSRDKETGKPMFSGFGNERNNVFIDRYITGYVIDLSSCIENIFSRDENLNLRTELKKEHSKNKSIKRMVLGRRSYKANI